MLNPNISQMRRCIFPLFFVSRVFLNKKLRVVRVIFLKPFCSLFCVSSWRKDEEREGTKRESV